MARSFQIYVLVYMHACILYYPTNRIICRHKHATVVVTLLHSRASKFAEYDDRNSCVVGTKWWDHTSTTRRWTLALRRDEVLSWHNMAQGNRHTRTVSNHSEPLSEAVGPIENITVSGTNWPPRPRSTAFS